MAEEISFPLLFDTCPQCEGKRRVAESVIASEVEKGKLGKGAVGGTRANPPVILANPRAGLIISAPALMITHDICVDCGWEYIVRVDKAMATPGTRPPAGAQGLPPGYPMGHG